jgi:APA family basic amino acid/polyamine antiporter
MHVPYQWCHSPLEKSVDAAGNVLAHGIMNVPAVFILLVLTLVLIRGTRESALLNGLIVITKVTIVILVIILGWSFINPANHVPYVPRRAPSRTAPGSPTPTAASGASSNAAGIVFFAFIGFDAVSTARRRPRTQA